MRTSKGHRMKISRLTLLALILGLVFGCKSGTDDGDRDDGGDMGERACGGDVVMEDAGDGGGAIDTEALEGEYADAMFARHLEAARRYRSAGQLDMALDQADRALGYQPSSEEAIRLRADILTLQGRRDGVSRSMEPHTSAQSQPMIGAWATSRRTVSQSPARHAP